MSDLDLDQYYTPVSIAEAVVDAADLDSGCIVDTACGEGSLLAAAERASQRLTCVGVDKDSRLIRRLRRQRRDWVLSSGDLLNPITFRSSRARSMAPDCSTLLLNPPFSLGRRKTVPVEYFERSLKTSVAMAHVLRSMELFAPENGAVAIVPESLLYSEADALARSSLGHRYRIEPLLELGCTTFSGAHARSVLVRLRPSAVEPGVVARPSELPHGLRIIRGGLPLFEAQNARRGLPHLHSTDIASVLRFRSATCCPRVRPIPRGIVAGATILLPRVGVPLRELLSPVYLRSRVQLSDCVIALRFESMGHALAASRLLAAKHTSLCDVYRGTGARYVTLGRLERWLAGNLP